MRKRGRKERREADFRDSCEVTEEEFVGSNERVPPCALAPPSFMSSLLLSIYPLIPCSERRLQHNTLPGHRYLISTASAPTAAVHSRRNVVHQRRTSIPPSPCTHCHSSVAFILMFCYLFVYVADKLPTKVSSSWRSIDVRRETMEMNNCIHMMRLTYEVVSVAVIPFT